jgi:hypothetical protein
LEGRRRSSTPRDVGVKDVRMKRKIFAMFVVARKRYSTE